jgi:hypothetical protein
MKITTSIKMQKMNDISNDISNMRFIQQLTPNDINYYF